MEPTSLGRKTNRKPISTTEAELAEFESMPTVEVSDLYALRLADQAWSGDGYRAQVLAPADAMTLFVDVL